MARKQRNELKAGLFVFVTLALLLALVLWLGLADVFKPERGRAVFYVATDDGSTNVSVGSFVQVNDAVIGKIISIRFDPEAHRTLYVAQIDRDDVKIHSDGSAMAAAGFVGGAKLVVRSLGTEEKPLADEDNPVHIGGGLDKAIGEMAEGAQKLNEIAGKVLEELDETSKTALLPTIRRTVERMESAAVNVETITTSIQDEVNRKKAESLLAKIHQTADNVTGMIADARPKVDKTLASVQETAETINRYAKEDLRKLFDEVHGITGDMAKISADLAETTQTAKELIVGRSDAFDEIIDNAVQISANLKAVSKEARLKPWLLLYQPDEEELKKTQLYNATRAFSDGAAQLDRAVAKLKVLQTIPGDDPRLKETVAEINEQLRNSFANFSKVEKKLFDEISK